MHDAVHTRAILEYVPDYRNEELHKTAENLRNFNTYNNKVFISSDKIPRQIQFYKQVKDEVNDRKR